MANASTVNISEIIDRRPLGAAQIRIVVLCGLVALLDGFDLQSIGLAAPSIAATLHIPPQELGAVFSAALAGLMVGAFALGPVADLIGRKGVLVSATLVFGIFTVCTAFASSFTQLLVIRFLTGVGLGGAMPSFIAWHRNMRRSDCAPRSLPYCGLDFRWAARSAGSWLRACCQRMDGNRCSISAVFSRWFLRCCCCSRCRNRSATLRRTSG